MNEMNVTNVVSSNSAYQTGTKAETKKASKEENVKRMCEKRK